MKKNKKYQIGGQSLFNTNKSAFVDSVFNANKNIDWVKRLYEQNAPSIQVTGYPDRSTHLMSDDGNGYVYPMIVQQNGKLIYLKTEDAAYDYAKQNNTGIQLPQQEGTWFANNGYKLGKNVNNSINNNGIPYNNPNYKIEDSTYQNGGYMKNKVKKFQLAGNNNPCGPGTTWDGNQCLPDGQVTNINRPTMYEQDYSGNSTNMQSTGIKGNGHVIPSQIKPLMNSNAMGPYNYDPSTNKVDDGSNYTFDNNAGRTDSRGTFIPSQNVSGSALDNGFNLDSDGVYRKNVITTDKNSLEYSDPFKALNVGLDFTSAIAGKMNDANTLQKEQNNLMKARYNQSSYNPYEKGLNNVPVYFKTGGELTPNQARTILHDGKVNGKKLTKNQYKFFGEKSKGNTLDFKPKGKMQVGGSPELSGDYLSQFGNFANSSDTHTINQSLDKYGLKNVSSLYDPTVLNNQPGNDVRSTRQDWIGTETMRAMRNARRMNIPPAAFTANANVIFGQDGRYGQTVLDDPQFKQSFPNYLQVANNIYKDRYNNFQPTNDQQVDNNPSTAQNYKMGGIHINPKHAGLFTKEAKSAGMSVQAFASKVLANKGKYSKAVVKRANFAHNFAQTGGLINNTGYTPGTDTYNNPMNVIPSSQITMKDTPFNVMAYPEQGSPILMNPGKNYNFGNSKYVTEVPMKQAGGFIPAYQPQYTMPSAYMADHLHPDYPTTPQDSTNYKNLFNQVLKNPNAYNLQDYEKKAQDNYLNHSENTLDVNKANYMKDAINAAAVRDALQQLNNNINNRTVYQTGGVVQPTQQQDTPQVQAQGAGPNAAELEQGEVYQSQQGGIQKIAESGDTHEDGGVVRNDVSRVLEDTADKRKDPDSKLLRVTPSMAQDIVGFKPKGTVTHSKLYEQATQFYDKKLTTLEGKLNINLDYINNGGGVYAKRALDLNLKLLQDIPTKSDLFDSVYNHQEAIKSDNNVGDPTQQDQSMQQQKVGGRVKFDLGGIYPDPDTLPVDPYAGGKTKKGATTPTGINNAFSYPGGLPAYQKVWGDAGIDLSQYKTNSQAQGAIYDYLLKNDPGKIKDMWKSYGNTAAGISQGGPSILSDSYLNDPKNLASLKSAYVDNYLGKRTLTPDAQPAAPASPAAPSEPSQQPFVPLDNTQYTKPNAATPSTFNEPLHWYDVAGNLENYLSADERTPTSFEQLSRDPLRVHELNPLPTLLANQGDYNAAVNQLPTNGVGFANQANMAANKYKVNNEVLGQYENTNTGKYDQVDAENNQNKFQLDQTNLNLRDRAQQQQLQGIEAQRQSKLKSLNDMFTTIAQNNKLNREGNLVMQMYPYFDQNGQYNGNQYVQRMNSEGNLETIDRQTGKVISTTTKGPDGQVKGSKYTVINKNK